MTNTGKYGELQAAKYLRKKKYNIIDVNYRIRLGEIDIIAENDNYLIFVEVKTRDVSSYIEPKEFVTKLKQRKIIMTAKCYLSNFDTNKQPRFDVIEIYTKYGRVKKINHIENAFELE